jgi:O-antigen/teichoic acid export membrane protein
MLPVFTRYLHPADFGIVAISQVLISFIAPFVGLSINGWIVVNYHNKDHDDLSRYISSCLLVLFVSSVLVSLFVWVFSGQLSRIALFPKEWLWSVVVIAISQFIIQITLSLWQLQLKSVTYGVYQIAQTILNICLSLWFIIGFRMNWEGRLFAQVLTGIIFGMIGLIILWQNGWIRFSFDYPIIIAALSFGLPIIPHELSGWIMAAIDRLFIIKLISVEATGIYAVGYQVVMIITLIETSFNTAWVPWLFSKLKLDDHQEKIKIVKITYMYVAGVFLFSLFLVILAPWLLKNFVGKEFGDSLKFIMWLATGKAITAMYFMTCNYIFYMKQTKYIMVATFTSAMIHIVATYSLIKLNGSIGAAQASILTSICLVILTWFFAQRVYKMPWKLSGQSVPVAE